MVMIDDVWRDWSVE